MARSARALSWKERSEPTALFAKVGHRVGSDATEKMFRGAGPAVRAEVAEQAEIGADAAKGVLEIVSLVTLATLVGTDSDGFTALMLCCQNGHEACARMLVDAGAAVDAAGSDGTIALMAR